MTLTDTHRRTLARASRILEAVAREQTGEYYTSPDAIKRAAQCHLATEEREIFSAYLLDNRHQLIKRVDLFTGTIDGAEVHPREVVKAALAANAAAVIFAHNHPSGDPEPSQADIRVTRRLKDALALVDVRVLDHIVVGVTGTQSLAERGDLYL